MTDAEKIIVNLINTQKITGEEALTLINAIKTSKPETEHKWDPKLWTIKDSSAQWWNEQPSTIMNISSDQANSLNSQS